MLALLAASTFAVSGAMAQGVLPTEIFGLSFSPACQAAVIDVLTVGNFATCFPAAALLPALTSDSSIIPPLDDFMSQLCYSEPCTNDILDLAAQRITDGCSSDLQSDGFSDSVVTTAFQQYPLVREILCTKTSEPYTEESYGGFLGAPAIPVDGMTYNSTDGYFCPTSVLSQLSAYFGTNITVPFITDVAQGNNETATELVTSINPNIICNECIFATFDIINQAYPDVSGTSFDFLFGLLNMTSPLPADTTLAEYANDTCAYQGMSISTDGTLPEDITVSIVNSTFSP